MMEHHDMRNGTCNMNSLSSANETVAIVWCHTDTNKTSLQDSELACSRTIMSTTGRMRQNGKTILDEIRHAWKGDADHLFKLDNTHWQKQCEELANFE
jgi:hypothetical protein